MSNRGPIDRNDWQLFDWLLYTLGFTSVSVLYRQLEWIASKIC
jgi:hypothetical protein